MTVLHLSGERESAYPSARFGTASVRQVKYYGRVPPLTWDPFLLTPTWSPGYASPL